MALILPLKFLSLIFVTIGFPYMVGPHNSPLPANRGNNLEAIIWNPCQPTQNKVETFHELQLSSSYQQDFYLCESFPVWTTVRLLLDAANDIWYQCAWYASSTLRSCLNPKHFNYHNGQWTYSALKEFFQPKHFFSSFGHSNILCFTSG